MRRAGMIGAGLALLVAGCARDPTWHLRDVQGIVPSLRFAGILSPQQALHAEDLRGQIVLVYFGYTHCPDVCPATLARLHAAVGRLGPGAPVRILFISVDPARDTPALLAAYAAAFGPEVVGLHVSESKLEDLARRYRVSYSRDQPDARGNYVVTHSSAVFIFDASGAARLLGTDAQSVADYAADLSRLRASSAAAS